MSKSDILTGFNNHLNELLEALISIIPDNSDLKAAQITLTTLRKANPRIVIPIWKTYVLDKYERNIMSGNIQYFLEKDYTEDVKDTGNAKTILEKINIVKNTIKDLDENNLDKTILYLQNITKLCKLYHS
tara:strand:+ start:38 stop:427 length:390 start_codon:yes stop_codon:yes gene_type:complete